MRISRTMDERIETPLTVAKWFGDEIRKQIPENPARAGKMIRIGLQAESWRVLRLPSKDMPRAYSYLNHMALKVVADALGTPGGYAWTNIFTPVELLESFGLTSVSMECLASYLSGFYLEDFFIDTAEDIGIATTLCSYHKNFIGAVESGILAAPALAITTSTICDGNINTFRYLEERFGVKDYVIDIPHEWSKQGQAYVVEQLEELIDILEGVTGRPYDEEALKAALVRENESKDHYKSFLKKRMTHHYPNNMTLQLFMLFASHLAIGSEWALKFYRMLDAEVGGYPPETGKRLFWVHLVPYAQPTLMSYLNYQNDMAIAGDDFNFDFDGILDVEHPLEALADKMICNVYNGDFSRKVDMIARLVTEYEFDAVVEFCHWGCKQSSGGAMLLKERMREMGVPMLVLDGDALDRRNLQDGQIKTRWEAFLEMLDADGGEGISA